MSVGARPLGQVEQHVVRIALVHDKQGKALVLLPAHALLNLASLWRLTGRQLQPVSCQDARRFFAQDGLKTPWGQQQLLEMPLVIDSAVDLKHKNELWEPFTGLRFRVRDEWLKKAEYHGPLGLTSELIREHTPQQSDVEAITRALEHFSALRVRQRLEDTLSLPGFSQTTRKLIMLRSDPDANIDDLLKVIKLDAPVCAQVMSWAASPYYAAPGKVESIEDAVIRVLGFDLVINLALGVAMGRIMSLPENMVRGGTPFWLQSVALAVFSDHLARLVQSEQRPKPGLVYLSGLLHNFGYLLLAHLFPAQFSTLSRYIEANPHLPCTLVEQQVLRLTREQVGAWLLENWDLPAEVCVAVRRQHEPGYTGEHAEYAQMIHIASRILRELGYSDGPVEPVSASELLRIGLTPELKDLAVESFLNNQEQLRELAHFFAQGHEES